MKKKNVNFTNLVVIMAAILAVILASGCTSDTAEDTSTSNVPTENISTSNVPTEDTSTSNDPVAEPQATDRYVEINLLDGTKIGGKYVSETAAFTTIIVMYKIDPDAYVFYSTPGKLRHDGYSIGPLAKVKDPDNYLVIGSGDEVSIKNTLINTMVTIDEPTPMIEATLREMNANAVAMKEAAEEIDEGYRMAAEARAAK